MRQLIKFCLVGLSSTIIDKGIFVFIRFLVPALPWWIAQSLSFCFGVTNGFIWNRRWTFGQREAGWSRQQYAKFVFTNIIGLGINLSLTKLFLFMFTGQLVHATNPDTRLNIIASLCATPIGVIWNFSASRFWTFRTPRSQSNNAPASPSVVSSD
ncbi:MAG TPA: GtrA family protein [Abditibacterium sp.]|jgi:putative flippase GtrA